MCVHRHTYLNTHVCAHTHRGRIGLFMSNLFYKDHYGHIFTDNVKVHAADRERVQGCYRNICHCHLVTPNKDRWGLCTCGHTPRKTKQPNTKETNNKHPASHPAWALYLRCGSLCCMDWATSWLIPSSMRRLRQQKKAVLQFHKNELVPLVLAPWR